MQYLEKPLELFQSLIDPSSLLLYNYKVSRYYFVIFNVSTILSHSLFDLSHVIRQLQIHSKHVKMILYPYIIHFD